MAVLQVRARRGLQSHFHTGVFIWNGEELPEEWRSADVTAIFKKGAVHDCDNYRLISLICVFYKMFGSLSLKRMQAGGAEKRLTTTQFGFRRGCVTADAYLLYDDTLTWHLHRKTEARLFWHWTGKRRSAPFMSMP